MREPYAALTFRGKGDTGGREGETTYGCVVFNGRARGAGRAQAYEPRRPFFIKAYAHALVFLTKQMLLFFSRRSPSNFSVRPAGSPPRRQ